MTFFQKETGVHLYAFLTQVCLEALVEEVEELRLFGRRLEGRVHQLAVQHHEVAVTLTRAASHTKSSHVILKMCHSRLNFFTCILRSPRS